jgi:hypothetical protein
MRNNKACGPQRVSEGHHAANHPRDQDLRAHLGKMTTHAHDQSEAPRGKMSAKPDSSRSAGEGGRRDPGKVTG